MERMNGTVSEFARGMDRMRRAWQNVTPCESLSKSQFATLLAIAHPDFVNGPPPGEVCFDEAGEPRTVRLTDLARTMRQSLPALSQRVSVLEALGYVERLPDAADRRATGLRVTEEGLRTLQGAYRRFDRMVSRAIDHLGQENLRTLLDLLEMLAEGLERAASDPDGTGSAEVPGSEGKTEKEKGVNRA